MAPRTLVWRGLDNWRAELAEVELGPSRLSARGVQIGVSGVVPTGPDEVEDSPVRYRVDYELSTAEGFVTSRLAVTASGQGWRRELLLERPGEGEWRCEGDAGGDLGLPGPGGDPSDFAEALDCDLGLSPLTNFMPVRREGLTDGGVAADFVMAWVAVPGLSVHRSEQRYEPIDARTVRYVGRHRSFVGELELDEDGLVLLYPGLGEAVSHSEKEA
ncbi:MAG: putative glycolipid-binding domain-containing protein [Solirubrobacterales bacterium]